MTKKYVDNLNRKRQCINMENVMTFSRLDARMLLRALQDPRVETVAIEYYAQAQLQQIIEGLEKVITKLDESVITLTVGERK